MGVGVDLRISGLWLTTTACPLEAVRKGAGPMLPICILAGWLGSRDLRDKKGVKRDVPGHKHLA